MKQTILALQPLLSAEMQILEQSFNVLRLWESPMPEETLQSHAKDIVGILSTYNSKGVSARMMRALPNLEIIAQFGAGYDNIDIEAAKAQNIAVTTTPDILTNDTADIAMLLMLSCARRAVEADMFVRVGRWQSGAFPLSISVTDKTVGIVGLGKIGSAIAQRAQAFGMRVIYHGRTKKNTPYDYFESLDDMARECDFLILACAGGAETKDMITLPVLEALGRKGYLINIARGSVVHEGDLLIALRNGAIAGAGLDVYADEPNVHEAMLSMDNVVLFPHIGSATVETRSKMGQLVINNFLAYFNGNPLLTPVKMNG